MSEYFPDAWVMVEIKTPDNEPIRKVLAGWSGGYLDGDSWKLSSGVTETEEDGDYYVFTNYSGSVYRCHKESQRLIMITSGILQSYQEQVKELDGTTIEVVEYD